MSDKTTCTYETKCRRCLKITDWYFGPIEMVSFDNFLLAMNDLIQFPRLLHCESCKKGTVQDVVSYNYDKK